jgi:hypothetical protein
MSIYDGKIEPLPTQKKTLTEQWREGTLESGHYYIRSGLSTFIETRYLGNGFFEGNIEVLAAVPDYNEYKQLVSKTDQLEKQLAIATKALKEIHDCTDWADNAFIYATEALKEMEGVK